MKDGNRKAFDEIYERYWKKLFLAAFKRIRSMEDSKDLIQDLFTSIWLKRETIEIKQTLSSYLFTSVKYKVINYVEAHMVRDSYYHNLKKTAQDYDNSTNERIFGQSLEESLEKGISNLSPKVKEVFEMSRKENMSIKEIATKLNRSDQTVKNQISTALKVLKLHLNNLLTLGAWLVALIG